MTFTMRKPYHRIRRDRYDGNGINKEGFHPFFTKAGKLRGGLEFLTEKPKLHAPWEKM